MPAVMNEPCQPIASPRADAGTTRLTWSTVAVMVGAHSRPATKDSAANDRVPPANAIGAVTTASAPSSQNAEIAWRRPP